MVRGKARARLWLLPKWPPAWLPGCLAAWVPTGPLSADIGMYHAGGGSVMAATIAAGGALQGGMAPELQRPCPAAPPQLVSQSVRRAGRAGAHGARARAWAVPPAPQTRVLGLPQSGKWFHPAAPSPLAATAASPTSLQRRSRRQGGGAQRRRRQQQHGEVEVEMGAGGCSTSQRHAMAH